MREIKFRCWNSVTKEMFGWEEEVKKTFLTRLNLVEMKLMQFTGLKDNTGKEIYEGDIVVVERTSEEDNPMVMMWNPRGTFNLVPRHRLKEKDYPYKSGYFCAAYPCVIIGNIYKNPELLEKKK